ncbi:antibiotic biosynthesis monooxygenase [Streptomyces sp. NPDC048551]|uniref:antibiotic biosynthesis monooxygenase n=1 Tax=Streptomyces sp. NPDC048551 TaxID=3155758 RepID=UPI003442CD15
MKTAAPSATPAPIPAGIHHVKLPVTDLERSARWYGAVLGARRLTELDHRRPDGTLFAVILDVPGLGTRLELRLDPSTSTALEGYDFLTLAVEDRSALDRWITHLDALDILHSPPVVALAGWLLVVPDPDGQRLRFYTTTHHGLDASRVEYDSPWLSTGPAPGSTHSAEPKPRSITTITARPGAAHELELLLAEFAATTRRENGCLAFRVHRTPQTPDTFIVYEEWTGQHALDAHHATPRMNGVRTDAARLMAAPPYTQPLVPCTER